MLSSEQICRNVSTVRARIAQAAHRVGRAPESVTLVAVTKTVDAAAARALAACGVTDLGESRVQELAVKQAALRDLPARWHMIGHVQTNKANKVLDGVELIHSVDSERLARALNNAAARRGATVRALLEVNVSGEAAKSGFAPDDVPSAIEAVGRMPNLRVLGLMTMAPFLEDPEAARPVFAELRQLRDRLAAGLPANVEMRRLSMGMSNDFEVAVEEGADMVRVGTALFREE